MRPFVSSTNYQPGSVILNDINPLSSVLLTGSLSKCCSGCMKRLSVKKRCSVCKQIHYCSANCQKNDWALHKSECSIMKSNERVPVPTVRLILRCLASISSNSTAAHAFQNLCCNLSTLDQSEKLKYTQLMEPLGYLLGREKFESCFETSTKCLETINRVAINTITIVTDELVPVGYGIFPGASLINHSCEPNAMFSFCGNKLYLRALRRISKDEEIFVSYTDQLTYKAERQKVLKGQFNFECNCKECQTDVREKLFTATETTSQPDNTIVKVAKNIKTDNCFAELEKVSKIVLDTNLHAYDLLVQCSNVQSETSYKDALHYEQRVLSCLEAYFPDFHPMKSLQYVRVAKILSYLGNVVLSVRAFQKALRNISVTHGAENDIYKSAHEQFILDQRELAHFQGQRENIKHAVTSS